MHAPELTDEAVHPRLILRVAQPGELSHDRAVRRHQVIHPFGVLNKGGGRGRRFTFNV
jgi:hypothetical protein